VPSTSGSIRAAGADARDRRPAVLRVGALLMILAERHPEARLAPSGRQRTAARLVPVDRVLRQRARARLSPVVLSFGLGSEAHPPRCARRCGRRSRGRGRWWTPTSPPGGPYMLGAEFSGVDLLALMYMGAGRATCRSPSRSGGTASLSRPDALAAELGGSSTRSRTHGVARVGAAADGVDHGSGQDRHRPGPHRPHSRMRAKTPDRQRR